MALTLGTKVPMNWGSERAVMIPVTGESSYTASGSPLTKLALGVLNNPKFVWCSLFTPGAAVGLVLSASYDVVNGVLHFFVASTSTPSSPAQVGGTALTSQEVLAGQNLSAYTGFIIVVGT